MALSPEGSAVCHSLVCEAIHENSVSKLQVTKSNYSENELVNSLAQCNEEGETPLIVAMKRGNYSVVEELVNWISKQDVYKKDDCKPIVIIIINQLSQHIPILTIIDYLFDDFSDGNWLEFIAQVFIKSTSFTRQDRIITLELIGSSLILNLLSADLHTESSLGLNCWKEAMTLRFSPADGGPLVPKIPKVCVPSVLSSSVFGSAVEVMTMQELGVLQEDFEQNYLSLDSAVRLPSLRRMQIQALLVNQRISTQASFGQPYRLYLNNLLRFGLRLMYDDQENLSGNGKSLISTCLLILEQLNGFDSKMLCSRKYDVFLKTLSLLSMYLADKLRAPPGSPEREELSYANMLEPTKFITTIYLEYFEINEDKRLFMEIVYLFLFILNFISPQLTSQEKEKLEEYYSKYILNFFPERTATVLHVAVSKIYFSENLLDTIKLILTLGADPNAIDEEGRTPLHILAGIKQLDLEGYLLLFKTLVDAGSHLDVARDDGHTVLSILKKNGMECKEHGLILDPYFESLLKTVFPLSCYAARVIRRNGILFSEDRLPFHLQKFVRRHSVEDFSD